MHIKHLFLKWLAPFLGLLLSTSISQGQGYLVEYEFKGAWITAPQSAPGTKIAVPMGAEASKPSTLNFRIRNTTNSVKNFNGAILGLLGNEGDFETGSIPAQVPFSVAINDTKSFTITYDPTCPTDQQPVSVLGTSGTATYPFNVAGTAFDSNATISPAFNPRLIISDNAAPSISMGTDFGELDLGGGSIPQASKELELLLVNPTGAPNNNILAFSDPKITGTHRDDFSLSGLSSSGSIASGGQDSFKITFNPSALGERNATFQVKVTDADVGSNGLYTFALRGTGIGTISYVIEGSADISPRTFSVITANDDTPRVPDGTLFPLTTLGTQEVTRILIRNTGDVALGGEIVSENISGPDAMLLASSVDILPGEEDEFALKFSPLDGRTTTALVTYKPTSIEKSHYSWQVEGTGIGPEIQVIGGSTPIFTNSTNTPSAQTGTIFSSPIDAAPLSMTYTIRNIGNRDLEIDSGSIQGLDGPFSFSGISNADFTLSPNQTRDFTVSYAPDAPNDTVDKTFRVESNDFNESDFTFTLRGIAIGQPIMRVQGVYNNSTIRVALDETPLIPDQNIVDYGVYASTEASFSRRFRLNNDGTAELTIADIVSSNDNYTIIEQSSTSADPGDVVEFRVLYKPDAPLVNDDTIITVTSDASNAPSYQFAITADVLIPSVEIYGGDLQDVLIANGARDARIEDSTQFPVTTPNSDPIARTFRIKNTGTDDYTINRIYINNVGSEDDPYFSGTVPSGTVLGPDESAFFTVSFQPDAPGTFFTNVAVLGTTDIAGPEGAGYSFQVSGVGADPNASPVFVIQGASAQQPILASGQGPSVFNGTDFEIVSADTVTTKQFLITNLSSSQVLDLASSFSPSTNGFNVTLGSTTVQPEATTTLTVTFDPNGRQPGSFGSFVRIDTNDPNAEPFFVLSLLATLADTSDVAKITSVAWSPNQNSISILIPAGSGLWNLQSSETLNGDWEISESGLSSRDTTVDLIGNFTNVPKRFYRLIKQP